MRNEEMKNEIKKGGKEEIHQILPLPARYMAQNASCQIDAR